MKTTSYRVIDEKGVPELTLGELYAGANDDGQMVDIYDRYSGKYIGTYRVERFEIVHI